MIDGSASTHETPYCYLLAALGARPRDEAAARQAFELGIAGMERIAREMPERVRPGLILPIVERNDPALVPEVLWLDLASRLPTGNPRRSPRGPG